MPLSYALNMLSQIPRIIRIYVGIPHGKHDEFALASDKSSKGKNCLCLPGNSDRAVYEENKMRAIILRHFPFMLPYSVAEPPLFWAALAPEVRSPGSRLRLRLQAKKEGGSRRFRLHKLKFLIVSS